jgi:hypothetical protein
MSKQSASSEASMGMSCEPMKSWSLPTVLVLGIICFAVAFLGFWVKRLDTCINNHYKHLVDDVNTLTISMQGIEGKMGDLEKSFTEMPVIIRENLKGALVESVRVAVRDELDSQEPTSQSSSR